MFLATPPPAVCYSSQRDAYLLLVGKRWRDTLSAQPWHVDGMTFRESLWGRFYTCDKNKDNYLDSDETLNCTSDTVFMARPNQDHDLTRYRSFNSFSSKDTLHTIH